MSSRLFRVNAYTCHSHFARTRELGVDAHLNTSFRLFVLLVDEFHLIGRKEMAPFEDLAAAILDDEKTCWTAVRCRRIEILIAAI
ncbi:Mitotic exit network component [Cladochytrium tenue]|nr:Mitotic exit network component [Cladochytrium tenue]